MATVHINQLEKIYSPPILKVDGNVSNYPWDSHKYFCKRCFKQHGKCPSTGRKSLDQGCRM